MAFVSREKQREYQRTYYVKRLCTPEAKEKRKVAWKNWSSKNSEHLKIREARRKLQKRAQCLVANARTRARTRGLAFDLDDHVPAIQKRIDCGVCEITGEPLDLTPGRKFNSPSIDRINPNLGYVYSNVRIVCFAINQALGDWGEETLRRLVVKWLSRGDAICPEVAAAFIESAAEVIPTFPQESQHAND